MRLINCQKVKHFIFNFLEVTVVFLIGSMENKSSKSQTLIVSQPREAFKTSHDQNATRKNRTLKWHALFGTKNLK